MDSDPKTKFVRILLRQQGTGLYLQASGTWGERDSAREFDDSLTAYGWAKEKQLLGAAVLMAVEDRHQDVVLARV